MKVWKCFIEVASETVETGAVDDITYLPVVARGLGYNYSITQTHSSHDASWHNTDPVLRATSQWRITTDFFNLGTLLNRRESISQAFTTPWSRGRKLGFASFSALISVFRYQIKHTFLCLIYTSDRLCNLCNVHDGMQVILVHRRGGGSRLQANSSHARSGTSVMYTPSYCSFPAYSGVLFLFVAVIKSSNTADSRRAYQCIKFLVQLANKCPQAKDYLLQNTSRWQWAVQWLKRKMNEHYWAPHTSSSNEYSSSRTFQRTSSAADTLAEATALLTELEAKDGEVNTSDEVDDSDNKLEGEDWEKEGMT